METQEANTIFLLKKESLSVWERQPWPLGWVCEGGLHCIMSGLHYGLLGSCRRIGSSASCLMDCSTSNCLNVYVKTLPYSLVQGFGDFPERRVCARPTMLVVVNEHKSEINNAKKQNKNVTIRKTKQIKVCRTDIETLTHGLIAAVIVPAWLCGFLQLLFDTWLETNMWQLLGLFFCWVKSGYNLSDKQSNDSIFYLHHRTASDFSFQFFCLGNTKRCCKSTPME